MDKQEIINKVKSSILLCDKNKNEIIATVASRIVNLLLALLFCKKSCKAKSEGKKVKCIIFGYLTFMFFVGALTSNVTFGNNDGCGCDDCDDDCDEGCDCCGDDFDDEDDLTALDGFDAMDATELEE